MRMFTFIPIAVQGRGQKSPSTSTRLDAICFRFPGTRCTLRRGVGGRCTSRKGTRLQAMMHGGSHERSRRAGDGRTCRAIVALGKAAEIAAVALQRGDDKAMARMRGPDRRRDFR